MKLSDLINRTVVAVKASDDGARIDFTDGSAVQLELYGDCCSLSFFTDTKQFDEIVGAKLLAVEQRDGEGFDDPKVEHVSPHFLVFTTDRGHVTIDWRNESNGYYDGWIEVKPLAVAGKVPATLTLGPTDANGSPC